MKLFFLGDLQLHAWAQYGSVGVDGINSRILDTINELHRVRKKAIKHHVDNVFIVGDIFQERGKLDVVVMISLRRCLQKFKKDSISVYLVLGNHDRVAVGNFHALEMFRDVAIIIDTPSCTSVGFEHGKNIKVGIVPFMSDSKETAKAFREFKSCDIILGHTAVQNVKLQSGKLWSDGIKLGDIPKKPFVFLGHYHTPIKLRNRVWYLGSLLHVDWSDKGQTKTYAMWDSGKVSFFPTHGPEFIELVISSIKDLNRLDCDISNNFIKVKWGGDIGEIGKLKTILLSKKARSVEIVPTLKSMQSSVDFIKQSNKQLEHMLRQSVQTVSQSERMNVLDLGRDILMEARNE